MSKKILAIIILCAIVLIAAIVLIIQDRPKVIYVHPDDAGKVINITPDGYEVNKSYGSSEGTREQVEKCKLIIDELERDNCFTAASQYEGYPFPCEEIDDDTRRDECYIELIKGQILGMNSIWNRGNDLEYLCNLMASIDSRDQCYEGLAINIGEINYCNKVGVLEARDDCYFSFASASRDKSDCDYIDDLDSRKTCKTMIDLSP